MFLSQIVCEIFVYMTAEYRNCLIMFVLIPV